MNIEKWILENESWILENMFQYSKIEINTILIAIHFRLIMSPLFNNEIKGSLPNQQEGVKSIKMLLEDSYCSLMW